MYVQTYLRIHTSIHTTQHARIHERAAVIAGTASSSSCYVAAACYCDKILFSFFYSFFFSKSFLIGEEVDLHDRWRHAGPLGRESGVRGHRISTTLAEKFVSVVDFYRSNSYTYFENLARLLVILFATTTRYAFVTYAQ